VLDEHWERGHGVEERQGEADADAGCVMGLLLANMLLAVMPQNSGGLCHFCRRLVL